MKGYQTIKVALPTLTYSAGGTATVPLRDLPKRQYGKIAHLVGVSFDVEAFDPTFTTAPTVAGQNNLVLSCDFHDGENVLFRGGFNTLRFFERIEHGANRVGEADTDVTSTNERNWGRMWFTGPPNFAGSPSDFAIPCAGLSRGEIKVRFGALTDLSADTTACTATVRPIAHIVLLDYLNVSPIYERQEWSLNAADNQVPGQALYAYAALANSASYDAIAAGDFGSINLDLSAGSYLANIDAESLGRAHAFEMGRGWIGHNQGEPRVAADTMGKVPNVASPTAITDAPADLQMLVWAQDDARITKLTCWTSDNFRLRWTGSQASGLLLAGRIRAQTQQKAMESAARALSELGLRVAGAVKLKTISKREYPLNGPFASYLPWKAQVG